MSELTVALLQILPHGDDVDANAQTGEAWCRRAAEMGADIALFPEMWSIGYARCPDDEAGRGAWCGRAVEQDSAFVRRFRSLATELRMAIAVSYLQRTHEGVRNAVSLVDRRGDIVLDYAKVHTCAFDWERVLVPGDVIPVTTLDTAAGPVTVGAMICYDREFPEAARVLALTGAEVILMPNACTMDQHRTAELATRSFENMVGIAMANYAGPTMKGRSIAFDGRAYTDQPDGSDGEPRDMLLVEADDAEGIFLARFDLAALRKHRANDDFHPWRQPRLYEVIASSDAPDPFRAWATEPQRR